MSLSNVPDRLLHPVRNAGDLIELESSDQGKKGKGGKKDASLSSLNGFEIPQVTVTKYTSANRKSVISDSQRHENVFRLRGTVSLQVYLNVTEKTTIKDLVDMLLKDLEIQFERRLALLKEAVEDNSKYPHF